MAWVAQHATDAPVTVLDLGGRGNRVDAQWSGSPRYLFPNAVYRVLDLVDGPDWVTNSGSAGSVCSQTTRTVPSGQWASRSRSTPTMRPDGNSFCHNSSDPPAATPTSHTRPAGPTCSAMAS